MWILLLNIRDWTVDDHSQLKLRMSVKLSIGMLISNGVADNSKLRMSEPK